MRFQTTAVIVSIFVLMLAGCSKKSHPTAAPTNKPVENKTAAVKKTVKTPRPKIITADDRAATKTPDGRLYYDFDGKRYWKNYDDGKYYLYNKNMYSNPAFTPH